MKKILVLFLTILSIVSLMACESSKEKDENIIQEYELDFPNSVDEIESIDISYSDGTRRVILDRETITEIYDTVTSLDGNFCGSSQGYSGCLYSLVFYTSDGGTCYFVYSGKRYTGSSLTRIDGYPPRFALADDEDEALHALLNNAFENAQASYAYVPTISCELVTGSNNEKIELTDEEQQQLSDIFNGCRWYGNTCSDAPECIFITVDNYVLYYNFDGVLRDQRHDRMAFLSDEDKAIINNILGIEE